MSGPLSTRGYIASMSSPSTPSEDLTKVCFDFSNFTYQTEYEEGEESSSSVPDYNNLIQVCVKIQ